MSDTLDDMVRDLGSALSTFQEELCCIKARLLDMGYKPPALAQGPETPLAATGAVADALGRSPEPPAPAAPSKHDRAVELAARWKALPNGDRKDNIKLEYMLSAGEALERSIESLPVKMLDDLNAALGMEEKCL